MNENLLENGFEGLKKYIKYKYVNPEHKENLTVKYTNKCQKYLQVMEEKKWVTKNKKKVVDEIYDISPVVSAKEATTMLFP